MSQIGAAYIVISLITRARKLLNGQKRQVSTFAKCTTITRFQTKFGLKVWYGPIDIFFCLSFFIFFANFNFQENDY